MCLESNFYASSETSTGMGGRALFFSPDHLVGIFSVEPSASLRCNTHHSAINENTSAALLPQIAPFRPNAQVAGTPTTSDPNVAIPKAANTDAGDSMARSASDGPKVALQNTWPRAKAGNR